MEGLVTSKLTLASDPADNPAKRAAIGKLVRARLVASPQAQDLGGERADLFLVPDLLTAQECAALVRVIDSKIGPSALFKGTEQEGFRTSSTHHFVASDTSTHALEQRIDGLLGLDHKFAEVTQGQRYLTGQQFRHHYDYFTISEAYWQQERRRGGQRSWSAMIFLNEPASGGETDFPELGLSVKPQTGALLTWNNMDRTGRPNPLTLHAGTPVVSGSKYVVTQWYRQDEWSLALR